MIALAVILGNAIAGGIWRRVLGGWLSLRRSYIVAAGALLTWPLWMALPPLYALLGSGLCILFFVMGHQFDSTPALLKRYGPFGIGWIGAKYLHDKNVAGFECWSCWGEVVCGGLFWGAIAALTLIG